MPLEEEIAGPGAREQGMTGAAGTTHPNEDTFAGITVLMALITTLIEKTSRHYGVPWGILVNSGAFDGPCGPED